MKQCAMANVCTSRDCPHWGPHDEKVDCCLRCMQTDCIGAFVPESKTVSSVLTLNLLTCVEVPE